MFGMLYKINGFIRREKKLTRQDEVVTYFGFVFRSIRGDVVMHKYIEDLKFILSLYES